MSEEGFMEQAQGFVEEHGEVLEGAVEPAAEFVKEQIGFEDQVDAAAEKASEFLSGGSEEG